MSEIVNNIKVKGMVLEVERGENHGEKWEEWTAKEVRAHMDLEVYGKPVKVELTQGSVGSIVQAIDDHITEQQNESNSTN